MLRVRSNQARRLVGGGMGVARKGRTREPRAIDERGVAEPIEHHALTASGERGDDGEVRHVAGGEEQRTLAVREGGELLLEPCMLGAVAGDEVRGTAAGAPLRGALRHGARERRVAREPEVVVAREVDELAAALESQRPPGAGTLLDGDAGAAQLCRFQ